MKKAILTMVLAVAFGATGFAQDNQVDGVTGASPQQHAQRQPRQRPSADQMAEARTKQMVERYGLDKAQEEKLLKLNKEYAGKMPRPRFGRRDSTQQAQRPSKEEMDQRFQEMRASREAYDKALKEILTDEQYKKYTEDRQRRGPQGRPGGRGHGHGPGSGPERH